MSRVPSASMLAAADAEKGTRCMADPARNTKVTRSTSKQPKGERRSKKWIGICIFAVSAVYFYFTQDSNQELWNSVNTYVSIAGGIAGVISFIRS